MESVKFSTVRRGVRVSVVYDERKLSLRIAMDKSGRVLGSFPVRDAASAKDAAQRALAIVDKFGPAVAPPASAVEVAPQVELPPVEVAPVVDPMTRPGAVKVGFIGLDGQPAELVAVPPPPTGVPYAKPEEQRDLSALKPGDEVVFVPFATGTTYGPTGMLRPTRGTVETIAPASGGGVTVKLNPAERLFANGWVPETGVFANVSTGNGVISVERVAPVAELATPVETESQRRRAQAISTLRTLTYELETLIERMDPKDAPQWHVLLPHTGAELETTRVTAIEETIVDVEQYIAEAKAMLAKEKPAGLPEGPLYATTAPVDYDHGDTVTVIDKAAEYIPIQHYRHGTKDGRFWRVVQIPPSAVEWSKGRYGSGGHSPVEVFREDVEAFLANPKGPRKALTVVRVAYWHYYEDRYGRRQQERTTYRAESFAWTLDDYQGADRHPREAEALPRMVDAMLAFWLEKREHCWVERETYGGDVCASESEKHLLSLDSGDRHGAAISNTAADWRDRRASLAKWSKHWNEYDAKEARDLIERVKAHNASDIRNDYKLSDTQKRTPKAKLLKQLREELTESMKRERRDSYSEELSRMLYCGLPVTRTMIESTEDYAERIYRPNALRGAVARTATVDYDNEQRSSGYGSSDYGARVWVHGATPDRMAMFDRLALRAEELGFYSRHSTVSANDPVGQRMFGMFVPSSAIPTERASAAIVAFAIESLRAMHDAGFVVEATHRYGKRVVRGGVFVERPYDDRGSPVFVEEVAPAVEPAPVAPAGPMAAVSITFRQSESDVIHAEVPAVFSGPTMWEDATRLLRRGIEHKARERREKVDGAGTYDKTRFIVLYPDGFKYEDRYDIGDPIATDLAEYVREHQGSIDVDVHAVPETSGPPMPTPFLRNGGVQPLPPVAPLDATRITFPFSESGAIDSAAVYAGPTMWQDATEALRFATKMKATMRRRNGAGGLGYHKTDVRVEYPDGYKFEARYDLGDPLPTDLAEWVRLHDVDLAHYVVPESSGPAQDTPFLPGGGVKPLDEPPPPSDPTPAPPPPSAKQAAAARMAALLAARGLAGAAKATATPEAPAAPAVVAPSAPRPAPKFVPGDLVESADGTERGEIEVPPAMWDDHDQGYRYSVRIDGDTVRRSEWSLVPRKAVAPAPLATPAERRAEKRAAIRAALARIEATAARTGAAAMKGLIDRLPNDAAINNPHRTEDDLRDMLHEVEAQETVATALAAKFPKVEAKPEADDGRVSVWVSLFPNAHDARALALPGGESPERLHVTMAYQGKHAPDDARLPVLRAALAKFASDHDAVEALTVGYDLFGAKDHDTLYLALNTPSIRALREALLPVIADAGLPADMTHPKFTPHVTLKVARSISTIPARPPERLLKFDRVTLVVGDSHQEFLFPSSERRAPSGDAARGFLLRAGYKTRVSEHDGRRYLFVERDAAHTPGIVKAFTDAGFKLTKKETAYFALSSPKAEALYRELAAANEIRRTERASAATPEGQEAAERSRPAAPEARVIEVDARGVSFLGAEPSPDDSGRALVRRHYKWNEDAGMGPPHVGGGVGLMVPGGDEVKFLRSQAVIAETSGHGFGTVGAFVAEGLREDAVMVYELANRPDGVYMAVTMTEDGAGKRLWWFELLGGRVLRITDRKATAREWAPKAEGYDAMKAWAAESAGGAGARAFREARTPVEAWAADAIMSLESNDPDRARELNGVGFSAAHSSDGMVLAHTLRFRGKLTEEQWKLAVSIAGYYRKTQVSAPPKS